MVLLFRWLEIEKTLESQVEGIAELAGNRLDTGCTGHINVGAAPIVMIYYVWSSVDECGYIIPSKTAAMNLG